MVAEDGGGSAPGGAAVELDLDGLVSLGQATSSFAADAVTAREKLQQAQGEASLYGQYPAAQALASHHDEVAGVFVQTLQALQEEIDELGVAMVQSARSYREADDAANATLAAISGRLNGTSRSGDAYDNARRDAGHGLTDPDSIEVDADAVEDLDLPPEATEALEVDAPGEATDASTTSTDRSFEE